MEGDYEQMMKKKAQEGKLERVIDRALADFDKQEAMENKLYSGIFSQFEASLSPKERRDLGTINRG